MVLKSGTLEVEEGLLFSRPQHTSNTLSHEGVGELFSCYPHRQQLH